MRMLLSLPVLGLDIHSNTAQTEFGAVRKSCVRPVRATQSGR